MYLKNSDSLKKWFIPIIGMLVLFTVFRVIFHIYNAEFLDSPPNIKALFYTYLFGLLYDFSIIFVCNVPALFLASLYGFFLQKTWLNRVTRMISFILNTALIFVSLADIPYFRFNSRRATVEVFDIMSDSSSALPAFFMKYWMFLLIGLLSIYLIWKLITFSYSKIESQPKWKIPFMGFTIFIVLFCINWTKTLSPKTVSNHIDAGQRTLAMNTPTTLLYSIIKGQELLTEKKYFSKEESKRIFDVKHEFNSTDPFKNRNIFIFVLESFSQEYLMEGHRNKAPTPFLDEIMQSSIVFNNAYANGTTSSYGLMNILGGIPPFLNEPYFSSIYGDNNILGIGTMLNQKGYTSSFFYGAEDDHYGFKKNMSLLGINNYYSKVDFKNNKGNFKKNNDGHWGIYDGPFFQYAVEEIKKQKKPVFATLFNISTHDPYMVPQAYKDQLPKGSMSSHQSLAYTDMAIRDFFESIKKEKWFDNSIFIFVADHWAKRKDLEYKNAVGRYRIPLFIYDPQNKEKVEYNTVAQQLDVIPTVLDYLDYCGDWMSFGRSAISETDAYKFTYNEYENIYQIIDSSFVLAFDESLNHSFSLYNYIMDPNLEHNIIEEYPDKASNMEKHIKAVIQTYNNRLIDNDLYIYPQE